MSPVSLIRNSVTFVAGVLFGVFAGYLAAGLQSWPGPVIVVFLAGLFLVFVVSGTAAVFGRVCAQLARDRLGRTIGHSLMIDAEWHATSRAGIYMAAYALGLAITSVATVQMIGATFSDF